MRDLRNCKAFTVAGFHLENPIGGSGVFPSEQWGTAISRFLDGHAARDPAVKVEFSTDTDDAFLTLRSHEEGLLVAGIGGGLNKAVSSRRRDKRRYGCLTDVVLELESERQLKEFADNRSLRQIELVSPDNPDIRVVLRKKPKGQLGVFAYIPLKLVGETI